MRKTALGIALLLALAITSHGSVLGTPDNAIQLKDTLAPSLLKINGINAVGVGACDPESGDLPKDDRADTVYCVRIYVDQNQPDVLATILKSYPTGTKIDGIFVDVVTGQPGHIAPRMSSGN